MDSHEASKGLIDLVNTYLPDRRCSILELGTNVGRNLWHLEQIGYSNIHGIEISQKAVDVGLENFGDVCNKIEVRSIEDYLLDTTEQYDLVFTMGVLMHIHPDSEWIFDRMADVATRYIIVVEVEKTRDSFRWARNYQDVFESLGMVQIETSIFHCSSPDTIMRMFRHGRI